MLAYLALKIIRIGRVIWTRVQEMGASQWINRTSTSGVFKGGHRGDLYPSLRLCQMVVKPPPRTLSWLRHWLYPPNLNWPQPPPGSLSSDSIHFLRSLTSIKHHYHLLYPHQNYNSAYSIFQSGRIEVKLLGRRKKFEIDQLSSYLFRERNDRKNVLEAFPLLR